MGDGEDRAAWTWDEGKPVARDFTDEAEVARYDAFHDRFRDVEAELDRLEGWFRPGPETRLGEFGCGTGRFVCRMAPQCGGMTVVDLSEAMLRQTRRAAEAKGIGNVEYRVGTFLTYRHEGEPLDGWNCSLALHHLPDAWKFEALRRLAAWTKPGGKLALTDVVWPDEGVEAGAAAWRAWLLERGGEELARDLAPHARKEFSTLHWIMKGLLERAGFGVEAVHTAGDGAIRTYFARKRAIGIPG